jgi:two-component system CheB/CheR fusion protein
MHTIAFHFATTFHAMQMPVLIRESLASAAHQRAVAAFAPPSVLVDLELNIVHLSEGAARYFANPDGHTEGALVALAVPELRAALEAGLRAAIDSGTRVETAPVQLGPAGRAACVSIVVQPFQDPAVAADYLLVTLDTKTNQHGTSAGTIGHNTAGAAIEAARKDEYLAIMAHELKHPLNLIHMHAEVLSRQPEVRSCAALSHPVAAIRSASISQAKIINDLLDISRVCTGKLHLHLERVDLAGLVSMIAGVVGATRSGPPIHLQLPPAGELHVLADEVRIEQVVWNLLSNAVKFTPPEGSVTVRLWNNAGRVVLQVKDTGHGLRASMLPTIFDIFKQDSATGTLGMKGLGIGLALVRQIVELHGGSVRASSPGPGRGATFTVDLPLSEAGTAVASADAHAGPAQVFKGLRILLIDDSADAVDVFAMLLDMEGAHVTATQSASHALELLSNGAFDLVLSDIHMPDMDGLEFIAAMRARAQGAVLPALAVTGLCRPQDVDKMIKAGYAGYLGKPLDVDALAREVARVLKRH